VAAEAHAASSLAGYALHDLLGEKIGRVEKLFVNGEGEAKFVRVRMGFLGLRSVLIPVKGVAVDEQRQTVLLR
jgi:hypothetical protein